MSSAASRRLARSRVRALGKNSIVATRLVRPRASSATSTDSRTVSSGKSVAAWNVRPSPRRARSAGWAPLTSSPSSSTRPVAGTNPPMAFMRVVLPAPLVPMSPTISPAAHLDRHVVVGLEAPERHRHAAGAQDDIVGHGGPSRPPDRRRGRRRRLLRRRKATLQVSVERAAGPVGDLDEPTREVEEQHEEAEARGRAAGPPRCPGRARGGR